MDEETGLNTDAEPAVSSSLSRMKSLLESYYGVSSETSESLEMKAKNMDSVVFNADVYMKDMLANHSLAKLLKKDDEFVQEVKTLDADMQLLVYENYSKFVSATDIIRSMREKVDDMETKIDGLIGKMNSIGTISGKINDKMTDKRSKIEKLCSTQRLVKKLNFLVELPGQLRKSIDAGALDEAVSYYNKAAPFLAKYMHVPSFAAINRESRDIISDVRKILLAKIKDDSIDASEFDKSISLLIDLEEPKAALITRYFEWHKNRFLSYVKKVQTEHQINKESTLMEFIRALNDTCLEPLMALSANFDHMFLSQKDNKKRGKGDDENGGQDAGYDPIETDFRLKRAFSATALAPTDKNKNETIETRKALVDFSKAMLNIYLDALKSRFASEKSPFKVRQNRDEHDASIAEDEEREVAHNENLLSAIKTVMEELRGIALGKDVLRVANLDDRAVEIAEHALRHQVDEAFGELRNATVDRLIQLHKETSVDDAKILQIVENTKTAIVGDINAVTRHLKRLLQASESLLSELAFVFENLVKFQLQDWYVWFANATESQCEEFHPSKANTDFFHGSITAADDQYRGKGIDISSKKKNASLNVKAADAVIPRLRRVSVNISNPPKPTPGFLLALSFLCKGMREHLELSNASSRNADTVELSAQLDATSTKVLNGYVTLSSQHISSKLRKVLQDLPPKQWLEMPPPESARDIIIEILEDITIASRQLHICGIAAPSSSTGQFYKNSKTEYEPDLNKDSIRTASQQQQHYTRSYGRTGAMATVSKAISSANETAVNVNDLSRFGAVAMDVDRMFSKKFDVFANVVLTRESIISGILKIFIKNFIECVRDLTFGVNGFQQIQLDVGLLRAALGLFVQDATILNKMLNEVISSARNRTNPYTALEQDAVDSATNAKYEQIQSRILELMTPQLYQPSLSSSSFGASGMEATNQPLYR